MAMKCDICYKDFRRMEDVYTHPYSFIRPRFVHRECISTRIRFLSAGGPHFSIATDLDMTIPSLTVLILLFIVLISYVSISVELFVFIIVFSLVIGLRIHFMSYYLKAVKSFDK